VWKSADGQKPTPSTLISLARSGPIRIERYEPIGTDLALAFSKIASADDALAFANCYGFLGIEKDTLAASIGMTPISELPLEIVTVGQELDLGLGFHFPAVRKIFTGKHKPSDRPVILQQKSVSIGEANATSIDVYTSWRDLRENVSIGFANAALRRATSEARRLRRVAPHLPSQAHAAAIVGVCGLLVEPVSRWLEEASALNKLMDMWSAIQAKNVKALGQMIGPDGRRLTETFNCRPPFDDAREHVRGLKGRAATDLLALAKEYLAQTLNFHLQASPSTTFLAVDSNGGWEVHSRPINLRAVLWTQFSEIVTGTRKIRPCEICGDLMDVTNNTRRKKVHDHCSQRECMRRYRRKLNGETGKG
jgi:hypothetical protein